MTKKQLEEELRSAHNKIEKMAEEREREWEMLKDYLGVEEQEYAELEETCTIGDMCRPFSSSQRYKKPVKKTKLVKKSKK